MHERNHAECGQRGYNPHGKRLKPNDSSFLDTLLAAKVSRKTDSTGVFSFHNHKFLVPYPACRGKTIDLVMSEKTGFKAMLGKKLYDIQYCDYHNNRHIKTLMPEVSQIFIDRYLRAKAKETTRNETGIFSQRPAGLQRAMNAP